MIRKLQLLGAAAATVLLLSTTANAETLYRVSPSVSDGVLNVRRGPSASYALVGEVPAGERLMVNRCMPPQDTYSKADWCEVQYQGLRGWSSTSGMMPVAMATPKVTSFDLTCTPTVMITRGDPNPVTSIRIRGTGVPGSLQSISVVQVLLNGDSYERLEQYNINTKLYSDGESDTYGWSGNWNKNPSVEMLGMLAADNYTERQTKNGVNQFVQTTPCARTRPDTRRP